LLAVDQRAQALRLVVVAADEAGVHPHGERRVGVPELVGEVERAGGPAVLTAKGNRCPLRCRSAHIGPYSR
jgi:hypothetical protein